MEKDIIQLKIDMGEVRSDMKHVKKEQEEIKTNMKDGFDKISDKIDSLDHKFSAKWVETLLIWVGRIIGAAIIGGVIVVIWKAAVHFIG